MKKTRPNPQLKGRATSSPSGAPSHIRRRPHWSWIGRALLVGLLVLVVGGGAWLAATKRRSNVDGAPRIPEVSLAGLAPEAARMIQAQLDEVRRSPERSEAWGRLGGLLKSCGFVTEAVECLANAERLSPKDPRWPYLRGTLPGNEVIAHLQRAVERAGRSPEMPRLRLARALIEAGQLDEARTMAKGILEDAPECLPARLLLAQIHQARGEWQQAVELAAACAESPITGRAAQTLLAMAHRRLGDEASAQRAARQAAARPPDVSWPDPYEEEVLTWRNDPRSLSDRAQGHLLSGRLDAALPLIERLMREHPDFAESWLLSGRALYLRKQLPEAEATLRRHLAMDPNSVNGHFQLGMSLLAGQKLAEAAASFRQAIALKSDSGPAHFNLGFALARMGQTREAIEPFRQAIRHNPEKIDSYILLADLHVKLGELAEAARLTEVAAQLDPDDRRLPDLLQKVRR